MFWPYWFDHTEIVKSFHAGGVILDGFLEEFTSFFIVPFGKQAIPFID